MCLSSTPFPADDARLAAQAQGEVLFLFINLDRSSQRRAHMEQQLNAHGLRYERISGVDGEQALKNFSSQQQQRFFDCHGKKILAGELGCYLSHLKALESFLHSDATSAVILEDDALLPASLDVLWASLEHSGSEWDFLRLQSRRNYYKLKFKPFTQNYAFCINITRSTGSTAYAVTKKAAAVLIEKLRDIEVPFDHAFDQPQLFHLKYRHIYPDIIGIADFNSTIETSPRQFISNFGKIKTLLWRAHTESLRFLWSIRAYAMAKTGWH
jgi:glycosyl transferase family 25